MRACEVVYEAPARFDDLLEVFVRTKRLGRHVRLQDAYGNRYTYAELGKIVRDGRKVVMPTGEEKRVPVDSENIRPRLYALRIVRPPPITPPYQTRPAPEKRLPSRSSLTSL